jgi:hypothetical protein
MTSAQDGGEWSALQVLTTMYTFVMVLRAVTPCGLVGRYQRFGGLYFICMEPGWLSQYSVLLRTGRPGDRGSIPGRGKGFIF